MPKEVVKTYKIIVREIASKDIVYQEEYSGTSHQIERRAGDVWSRQYSTMPDRYRLRVSEKGQRAAFITIG